MSRPKRELIPGHSYHVTVRCNNREFRLTRLECRQVLLYALKKAIEKFGFKLYALCIMSNHIHSLKSRRERRDHSTADTKCLTLSKFRHLNPRQYVSTGR